MKLKAVLFDVGETLISTRVDWSRVVPECLIGLEQALSPVLVGVDFVRLGRDFLFLRAEGKKRADREHRETPATDSLQAALDLQGVHGTAVEILQQGVDGFFAPEENDYTLIAGIPETLNRIKDLGLKLGVISNATCGQLIRRALAAGGLLPLFDRVVVSAETGVRKPDPAIFQAALQGLGTTNAETAMVGDLLDKDIAGANRAGLRSVLVDFHGEGPAVARDGPLPNAVAERPADLVAIIQAWLA